jgi:tRNA splicing ligase
MTFALLSGRTSYKNRYELSESYLKWVTKKIASQPELFQNYVHNQGIILIRNLFLVENNINISTWESIIDAAKETTKEYVKDLEREEEEAQNAPEGSDSADIPQLQSSKPHTYLDALPASPPGSESVDDKILIIPISIVGMGKTTVGKVLSALYPDDVAHIQSDDNKKKASYLLNIRNRFKKRKVVFADRCNHLPLHRQELCQMFKEDYPMGRVLAVEWDVKSCGEDEIAKLARVRIEER